MPLRALLAGLCCACLACASPAPTGLPRPGDPDLEARLGAALAGGVATSAARTAVAERFASRALRFEPNRGQIEDATVRFAARGERQDLWVTASGFAIAPRSGARAAGPLRVKLVGAARAPLVEPLDRASGLSHYYRGDDPTAWQREVPGYARVALREVYPGIDLVLRANGSELEYDFEVAPGAEPAPIELEFENADAVELDAAGNLGMKLGGIRVEQRRPRAFQEFGGARVAVAARWVRNGERRARFALAAYDPSRPLVIDPVVFVWSTYLGGSDFNSDSADAIAVGRDGRVYVAGRTGSADFPTANASQPLRRGLGDAFVSVFEPDGQQLVYSTFLGGSASEAATGVAVDENGRAFVTGETYSPDFPTLDASQPAFGGRNDAFLTVLDASGALVRSTFLGGRGEERGGEVALDAMGRVTVAGSTASPDFPATAGAFDESCGTDGACNPTFGFPELDLFAARFDAGGALDYATFLGGETYDFLGGLGVDGEGAAYLAGFTWSDEFPTQNALQPSRNGIWEDAVVAKLSPDGAALVYSTYLGGGETEFVGGLAVDADGNAYVTGSTQSEDFPLVAPYQSERRGYNDAFVAKLPPDGSELVYSTLLGGNGALVNGDAPFAIALDGAGRAHLAGETTSGDFPLVQPRLGAAVAPDSFVAVLDASGSSLVAASYIGGIGYDTAYGLAVGASGDVYVAGITERGYPIEDAFQPRHAGGTYDAFVARLSLAPPDLVCEVATSATQYGDGDRIEATRLRFANETGFDVFVRVALALVLPDGTELSIARGSGELAEGFDRDLAPAAMATVGPGTPRGEYALQCELADPATGTHYATGEAHFAVR